MKTLHLRDENYNWKSFEYENISELKKDFNDRSISIGNRASIGNGASIGNEIKLITGFYINGSIHTVTYVGEGKISIGCHTKKISWFKKNYKTLGEKENYTECQQKEYYVYIKLAEMFYKSLLKTKVK